MRINGFPLKWNPGGYHILKFHVCLLRERLYGGGVGEQRPRQVRARHRSNVLLLASCLLPVVCCLLFVVWSGPVWAKSWLGTSGRVVYCLLFVGQLLARNLWEASGKLREASGVAFGSFWEAPGSAWEASWNLLQALRKLFGASGTFGNISKKPLGAFGKPV